MNYTGELAALAAAFFWAMASVIYRRLGVTIPPLLLNGIKGLVSLLLIGLTMLMASTVIPVDNLNSWLVLLASGAVGIGLGDTAFFAALNSLGERRTVLTVETLAPPLAVVLSALLLREFLSSTAMMGILVTLAGVFWVLSEKKSATKTEVLCRKGIAWGAVAAFCQALGGVMSRDVLKIGTVDPLWSAAVRLLGGLIFVAVVLVFKHEKIVTSQFFKARIIMPLLVATFFGTYLAIFLQQLSYKHTEAAITQTMIATSAIFIIPLAMMQGEKTSLRALLGSIIALAGIAILFFCK